jgi:hypothetical protein
MLADTASAVSGCTDDGVTSPTTDPQDSPTSTFDSILHPDGSATQSVVVSNAGTLIVRLDAVSPPASVGLALGLARSDGSGCYLTAALDAAEPPAELTTAVDPGRYCVQVFDPGELASEVAFSLTITRP